MRLVLPLPPAINRRATGHWAPRMREKNRFKAETWLAALEQARPRTLDELPERVVVQAMLFMKSRKRDEDKLAGCLDWTLDALKCSQPESDPLHWKWNIATEKGYFRDDDPDHLTLRVAQAVDRKAPRLELTIDEAA